MRLFRKKCVFYVNGSDTLPPPLTEEEEEAMLADIDKTVARDALIVHNLRLVVYIAKRFENTGAGIEELVSIGTVGLIKAISTFNSEKNIKLATYASRCIQNEILMHFRSQKKLSAEVSLEDTIDVDRDGNPLTYMDVISSEESLESEMARKLSGESAINLVKQVCDKRERQIIVMRYGLAGRPPLTQKRVAELLGISRSYVSRLEKSALDKLRSSL